MAKGDIVSAASRPLTDEEADLIAIIEAMELKALDHLEAGARQIISLVTAFYGVLFGVLSLGSPNFAASLRQPGIVWAGVAAVLLLLGALGAALVVVLPRAYHYGDRRLDQQKAAYQAMLAYKSNWLQWAILAFGLGLAAFATLIGLLLVGRL
ncbi:MAG: hypothetical protein H6631_06000 [Anaerolineaceae bacterium]|nr:hypothetical protein [Anaerolineaceae bacterium]